ncbi:MAG: hypothetical protein C5B59_20055 [Bacteroidetes bacterium]|nr:MAG: hypothetical protein C5B59_20055 [Bacteroidota bacterium]
MKSKYFLSGTLAFIIAVATLVACKKYNNNYSPASGNAPVIHMKGSVFSNANIQVSSGTTVMWNNDDMKVHTVTADNGSFNSGDIQPGASFSFTFKSVGTFAYHDMHNSSMTGMITVVANNGGGMGGY